MQNGIFSMNTDEDCIPLLDLARLVEDSGGIESLLLPDHSHVPVSLYAPVKKTSEKYSLARTPANSVR
ncbi:hypothetical protein [Nocardia mangyaensis]|uniref:hypothetical protein n=1 Tax=Nocardia mangyaensis TaxID=2213200 RepID=UPI0012EB1CD0|nr:hypothetical protein [Nocardia mangyaensis]